MAKIPTLIYSLLPQRYSASVTVNMGQKSSCNHIHSPLPEFIDPVFAKTSLKRSFSVIENERFRLVFANTGSIISGTWQGYIVESGIWLSYHPASLCSLAVRYDIPMSELILSLQSGTMNLAIGICWRGEYGETAGERPWTFVYMYYISMHGGLPCHYHRCLSLSHNPLLKPSQSLPTPEPIIPVQHTKRINRSYKWQITWCFLILSWVLRQFNSIFSSVFASDLWEMYLWIFIVCMHTSVHCYNIYYFFFL